MASSEQTQDAPSALERSIGRFDTTVSWLPQYLSTNESVPSDNAVKRYWRSQAEDNEIIHSKPTDDELYTLGRTCRPYNPGHRFQQEFCAEIERIRAECADKYCTIHPMTGRFLNSGPDLMGHAGLERVSVMARHRVKQSWQQLETNCWNPSWTIPGVQNTSDIAWINWVWPWHNDDEELLIRRAYPTDQEGWPVRSRETPDHQEVRKLLDNKGHWGERAMLVSSDEESAGIVYPAATSFITSRPWYRFELEAEEEQMRLARSIYVGNEYFEARDNVKARWQAQGIWNSKWNSPYDSEGNYKWDEKNLIGWTWKDESPSPKQEAVGEMEFTPSEIDAMEKIEHGVQQGRQSHHIELSEEENHSIDTGNPAVTWFDPPASNPFAGLDNAVRSGIFSNLSPNVSPPPPSNPVVISPQSDHQSHVVSRPDILATSLARQPLALFAGSVIRTEPESAAGHSVKGTAKDNPDKSIPTMRQSRKRKRGNDNCDGYEILERAGLSATNSTPATRNRSKRVRFDEAATPVHRKERPDKWDSVKLGSQQSMPVIVETAEAIQLQFITEQSARRRSARIRARQEKEQTKVQSVRREVAGKKRPVKRKILSQPSRTVKVKDVSKSQEISRRPKQNHSRKRQR